MDSLKYVPSTNDFQTLRPNGVNHRMLYAQPNVTSIVGLTLKMRSSLLGSLDMHIGSEGWTPYDIYTM